MNTQEFSYEFDILYNNIASNAAPGLSEYEKSVLLTQAQEELVLAVYNGTFNSSTFEDTEEVKSYINNLVRKVTLDTPALGNGISSNSVFYTLPKDIWFITYESVILEDESLGCANGITALVKPITQDQYYTISQNPFRGATKKRVLRLLENNVSELISKYKIKSYLVVYLVKPNPIILDDLTPYGASINGKTERTECELNPVIHRTILNRAVQLAKAIWLQNNQ